MYVFRLKVTIKNTLINNLCFLIDGNYSDSFIVGKYFVRNHALLPTNNPMTS